MTLTIKGKQFYKDEKPFFYLADTCWSAFTNITEEDWLYYLQYRKKQGYNTLQINILPQWDASATSLEYFPYAFNTDGSYDFNKMNPHYFDHARKMCEIAKEHGFELALVVLWCNYVPKTWANNMNNQHTMPFNHIETYIDQVINTFDAFDPIYVVSGDTDLEEEISKDYYRKASDLIREKSPKGIQTLHVRGRLMEISNDLIDRIDFYMFQSGHNAKQENLSMTYKLPEYFVEHYPEKPLINSEPCYEQMGHSSRMYGRFYPFDIRRATWQSILSGATSGITYGAGGIYSWHTYGKKFEKKLGEGFDSPNPWQLAVHYPGAWDYSDIKHIMEDYCLYNLKGQQILLLNQTEEIRLAISPDKQKIIIYVPHNTTIKLDIPLIQERDKITIIDLETRHKEMGQIYYQNNVCCIGMHMFNHDALYIIERA